MTEQSIADPQVEQVGAAAGASRRPRLRMHPRKLRRWQWMLLGAGGLAVAAGGYVCLSMQSPMPVGSVVVEGASADLQPLVSSALGITEGQSFRDTDESSAVQRITAIEGVRGADLRWTWWNTLAVRVDERTPVALLVDGAGAFVVIDADGAPIRTVPARPAGLAVVQAGDDPGRRMGLQVAQALTAELAATTDAILVEGPASVSLRMLSGATVVLGSADDLPVKLQLAQQLLAGTPAQVINVSVPARPAVSQLPPPPKP